MKQVIVIEAEEEDVAELISLHKAFRTASVPVISFAAKVFKVLDGVRSITPATPQHPITEAPDVEP